MSDDTTENRTTPVRAIRTDGAGDELEPNETGADSSDEIDPDGTASIDSETADETTVRRAAADADVSFSLIVAVAANGVIGADGGLPWDLPEDMAHFERTTTGHPVVLGRRTHESIVAGLGEPLPDRTSLVLSRQTLEVADGAVHVESVPAAIRRADRVADRMGVERVYVAGGATVYDAFLPVADRMVRTELADSYDGDTQFPDWNRANWTVTDRDDRDAFAFVTYERNNDAGVPDGG